MRFCSILAISVISVAPASAEEQPDELAPEAKYLAGLRRLDQEFIEGMRKLAANAASIRVCRLGESRGFLEPFESPQDEEFFRYPDHTGEDDSYRILDASPFMKETEFIERWAAAVLPDRSGQLLLNTFEPTFAVRFFDGRGGDVYATTLSPRFGAAGIEFPRYVRAIGVTRNEVKALIEAAGPSMPESKSEQGSAGEPAAHAEPASKGGDRPQPESEGCSR